MKNSEQRLVDLFTAAAQEAGDPGYWAAGGAVAQ